METEWLLKESIQTHTHTLFIVIVYITNYNVYPYKYNCIHNANHKKN